MKREKGKENIKNEKNNNNNNGMFKDCPKIFLDC